MLACLESLTVYDFLSQLASVLIYRIELGVIFIWHCAYTLDANNVKLYHIRSFYDSLDPSERDRRDVFVCCIIFDTHSGT